MQDSSTNIISPFVERNYLLRDTNPISQSTSFVITLTQIRLNIMQKNEDKIILQPALG